MMDDRIRRLPFASLPSMLKLGLLTTFVALRPIAACSVAAKPVPTIDLHSDRSWPIQGETFHVQGLAVSDRWFWITSVDRAARQGWIFRVDRDGGVIDARAELVEGKQYHPGGMQLRDGKMWIPLAEYRPRSTTTMLRVDGETLTIEARFSVADHLGGAAIDNEGRLYTANWDTRTIYTHRTSGEGLKKAGNPTGVAYQDMEWHDGLLFAAGRDRQSGPVVDVIDTTNGRHVRRYRLRGRLKSGGDNFSREGFCLYQGAFYVLPEDGPQSVVYRFPLPDEPP